MKRLPLILALLNATVSIWAFTVAAVSPERSGLMPIIVFAMDLPVSFLLIQTSDFLYPHLNVGTALCVEGAIFTAVGSLWFYFIGWIISRYGNRMRLGRRARDGFGG